MELQYHGKVALITGGARGIGYATAKLLARAGVKLALADINGELAEKSARSLAQETGTEAIALATDVTVEAQVRAMGEEAAGRLGPAGQRQEGRLVPIRDRVRLGFPRVSRRLVVPILDFLPNRAVNSRSLLRRSGACSTP